MKENLDLRGIIHKIYICILFLCLLTLMFSNPTHGKNLDPKELNGERHANTNSSNNPTSPSNGKSPKLLVIMLDGFRWDYYDIHKNDMVAFGEFLSDGVRAEWVEPIFPSKSYPSWTTISTGVFPEVHGIIGNYMYDQSFGRRREEAIFDLDNIESTKRAEWWQNAEPLWISATRERKRVFLRYWSRCDVPFQDTLPNGEFSGYRSAPGIQAFKETMEITLQKLRDNDLLMVYTEHIDNIGHTYGPDSNDMALALKDLNRVFKWFLDELFDNYQDVEKELNIVIVSDHGMAPSGSDDNVTHVHLGQYINPDHVMKILDFGGVSAIAPFPKFVEQVYTRLKQMPGVDVYKREEIPAEYHYKSNRLVLDILLVARPSYHIVGFPTSESEKYSRRHYQLSVKQFPESSVIPRKSGSHGYVNREEMRAIFFAKGPEFKQDAVIPPIGMEDIYQVFTRVLGIKAQPHNGTWSRVSGMFKNSVRSQYVTHRFIFFNSAFTFIFISVIIN